MPTVQFNIPKAAADALDFAAIQAQARAGGVENPRIEYNTMSAGPTQCRITCSPIAAPYVIDALTAKAASSRGEIVLACTEGAHAGLRALAPLGEGKTAG